MTEPTTITAEERQKIEAELQAELTALAAEQKQVLSEYRVALEAKKIESLKAKLNGRAKEV